MKKSKKVWLGGGFLAVVAGLCTWGAVEGLTEHDEVYYDELCVDRVTLIRVEDQVCEDGANSGTHGFVYVPYSSGVSQPKYPVGSRVTGGSFTKPSGGGTFLRGGFGGVKGGSSGG